MSMVTYVVLLRSPDDTQYQAYLQILLACKAAMVAPPPEVDAYFGGNGLDNEPEAPLEIRYEPRHWGDGNVREGLEIDLATLPSGVSTIRFVNSW